MALESVVKALTIALRENKLPEVVQALMEDSCDDNSERYIMDFAEVLQDKELKQNIDEESLQLLIEVLSVEIEECWKRRARKGSSHKI